ncbi:MAG: large repetitive protein [Solirubrobacteraceae bacterium]|nr:large repetitive protein [Solirubrobacteraceae bacterium]
MSDPTTRPPPRPRRGVAAALLGAAALLCLPAATAGAAEISVTDGVLSIRDTAAEHNVIDVIPAGIGQYVVVDQATAPVATAGCTQLTSLAVHCTFVSSVRVEAGGGDDLIGLQEVTVPVTADGGDGTDLLEAGSAAAVMNGGDGIDSLIGGASADTLAGGRGDDLLTGGASADALQGNGGDDMLAGQGGSSDDLQGGSGRDLLSGGSGQDAIAGGAGADVVVNSAGDDRVSGHDEVVARRDEPQQWPPPPSASASAANAGGPGGPLARAAIIEGPGSKILSDLRIPGRAQRFSILVRAGSDYDIRVRVRIYFESGPAVSFVSTVNTKHRRTYELPERMRSAQRVTASKLR